MQRRADHEGGKKRMRLFSGVGSGVSGILKKTPAATTAASSTNLQTFAGALGGVTAPTVTALGNGEFQVEGNSAFNSLANALERSW